MRPEVRERFLLAADASVKALGGTSFQDGISIVRRSLAKLTEIFDTVRSPELVAQGLDSLELTPELEEVLVQTVENGPLLVRWIVMKLHQSAESDLPTLSKREPAVSGRVQVEILRFINKLNFEQSVPMEVAKKRAAQRFGCSVRTIERYWREKKRILANGPKYHFNDLLKELKNAIESDAAADIGMVLKHQSDSDGARAL